MRLLAIDPGAFKCGWCVLQGEPDQVPNSIASGIFGLERGKDEKYQPYRLRLIQFWVKQADYLLSSHKPDLVVNEIIPAVGGGNFVIAAQSQLAATAITTIQTIAYQKSIEVRQIGATTVKKKIAGNGKATKVQVRNGVYAILPETKIFHNEWTKVYDQSDAFAIGLTAWGLNGK